MSVRIFSRYARPDFLIIGAQKAGTTALFHMLNQHSQLFAPDMKEVHYFDNDEWYEEGRLRDYHQRFPRRTEVGKRGRCFEVTPMYLFHPKVAERIFNYNPEIKLIAILRDPSERAFSAWTMYHYHFREGKYAYLHDPRRFDEAVAAEMGQFEKWQFEQDKIAYVRRGIYVEQLQRYYRYFKSSQVLIIDHREMLENFGRVSAMIQDFVGVPYEALVFEGRNRREVDDREKYISVLSELKAFYRPYNADLFRLLNRDFRW
jgi:hypothetical protein